MKISNPLAVLGEDLACEVLRKKGYKIIERNFRKGYGEKYGFKTETKSAYETEKGLTEKTVKEIFGKATSESRLIYRKSKEILAFKLSELQKGFSKINKKKYQRIVAEVVEDVAQEKRMPRETLKKLQKYLESDFKKLKMKNKKL